MANIYKEANQPLHELLDKARSGDGATVLIPDLQRPYVWTPNQVVLLVDSLIRGWPFGTLLMWRIHNEDLPRIPHRSFWQLIDRTEEESEVRVERRNPPASYHMVLDGQQRVQSLLLAVGGDSWGFKLEDRDWALEIQGRRLRGRVGRYRHWSKASLCFDLVAFEEALSNANELVGVDFRDVLKWVVTDPSGGQSIWKKPENYDYPLPVAKGAPGRYIRFARLWAKAGTNAQTKEARFKDILRELFTEECVPSDQAERLLDSMGELMTTLRDVKLSPIVFLELQPYDGEVWTEEDYNDAIVNIFTRLNTAGRTLTREEITLAWLKVGWDDSHTGGKSAGECFEELRQELKAKDLDLGMDELVSAVSFLWAVTHNDGRLLENKDLLRGPVIQPMSNALAEDWNAIQQAILDGTDAVRDRGLRYGGAEQYQSINSVIVLWAWFYLASRWERSNRLNVLLKDSFEKTVREVFDLWVDRWVFATQWANRWSSTVVFARYAKELADDAKTLGQTTDSVAAQKVLANRLETFVTDAVTDAVTYVQSVTTQVRERVAVYRTLLWVWHRLEAQRWKMSGIALRTARSRTSKLEVDHTVAWAHWKRRLGQGLPTGFGDIDEALPFINRLGNCALLEKSFNISKSDRTLKGFLDDVHEFKNGSLLLNDWAEPLKITAELIDPTLKTLDEVRLAIETRDTAIRADIEAFLRGSLRRVDV